MLRIVLIFAGGGGDGFVFTDEAFDFADSCAFSSSLRLKKEKVWEGRSRYVEVEMVMLLTCCGAEYDRIFWLGRKDKEGDGCFVLSVGILSHGSSSILECSLC